MTITRSDSSTASLMLWVTKTTVLSVTLHRRRQLFLHRFSGNLVECREGLVHQKDRRPESKRPAKRNALLHAAGQFMRQPLFESPEPGERQPLARLSYALRRGVVPCARFRSLTEHCRCAVRHGSSNGR